MIFSPICSKFGPLFVPLIEYASDICSVLLVAREQRVRQILYLKSWLAHNHSGQGSGNGNTLSSGIRTPNSTLVGFANTFIYVWHS
jgi:hypothetical protein